MAFIAAETLSGVFQWVTVVAIALAASAFAFKIIYILRDSYLNKKALNEEIYPPQESDDYVTLLEAKEYEVNEYETVDAGTYFIETQEESVRIGINGSKKDYKNGDVITLAKNDVVCSLFFDVVLKPVHGDDGETSASQSKK